MICPKPISDSWVSAVALLCGIVLVIIYLLPEPSNGTSGFYISLYFSLWLTVIFAIPSSFFNWLYDKRGYAQTQRDWMKAPSSLFGRIGYILTGSIALWGLLLIGMVLGAAVFGGLFALGQTAWSS